MKALDFNNFVAQLDVLSEVQREALMAALKGKGSASEVIALIETQFAGHPCCGHCKSVGRTDTAPNLRTTNISRLGAEARID